MTDAAPSAVNTGPVRRRWMLGASLMAPLLLLLVVSFLVPIVELMRYAVIDLDVRTILPHASQALRHWDHKGVPDMATFEALAGDLAQAVTDRRAATVARRLNYAKPGARTLIMNTARHVAGLETPPQDWRVELTSFDAAWGDEHTWDMIDQARGPLTSFYLLYALDLRPTPAGRIQAAPPDESLFIDVLLRTFTISATVTIICLTLAFPVAFMIAHASPRVARLMLMTVLIPFWTSLLVRLAAWVVLLQDKGLVNDALMALGLTDVPIRLMYNRTGVLIAMVHVLLPFMVLPIYGVMRSIPATLVRAARSLGAPPAVAFWRIYLPQTKPGVFAGVLIVFIMAIGYYITPALVGGAGDQMISWFIAYYTTEASNWGLAAALAIILTVSTVCLYAAYHRLTGVRGFGIGQLS